MKRILGAVMVLMLSACGLDAGSEFRNGYPKPQDVTISVPSNGQALSGPGTKKQALLGEIATFYQFTRGVTVIVNGAGVVILSLVKTISDYPPTSADATHAVWGPWTDSLSPNTYKFTVTKNKENDFSYVLEARGKNEADSAFRTILSGSHNITAKDMGKGTFLLDWDAAATLPEHDSNVGSVTYEYSHVALDQPVDIVAHFKQVKDNNSGKLIDVDYTYHSEPNNGGSFEFLSTGQVTGSQDSALENLSVNSRWKQDGEGRSDVRVNGGDLTAEATATECWDANFASQYLTVSYDPNGGWGKPTACAFSDAQFSVVAPQP